MESLQAFKRTLGSILKEKKGFAVDRVNTLRDASQAEKDLYMKEPLYERTFI